MACESPLRWGLIVLLRVAADAEPLCEARQATGIETTRPDLAWSVVRGQQCGVGAFAEALQPMGSQGSYVSRHQNFVGQAGFEPTTSSSRTRRATKLRHCPCCRSVSLPALGERRECFLDGPQSVERIERFNQPPVGSSSASQEDIGFTVKQQIDDARFEPTRLLFLADCQTGSYAPHIADLKIQQHQVGVDLCNSPHDIRTAPYSVNKVSSADCGFDVVNQPIGVGGKKNVGHAPNRTPL